MNVKIRPVLTQYKNAELTSESRITFFIKIASVPNKIKAINLYIVALFRKILEFPRMRVPIMIRPIPKISIIPGYSFKNIMPVIKATIGL